MNETRKNRRGANVVFALLLAILLWLYVVNVENPVAETTFDDVPVTIHGVEALNELGLMVTDLSRDSMDLKIRGNRKTFLKLYNSVSVTLDVSAYKQAGEVRIRGKYVLPDLVAADGVVIRENENFYVTVTIEKKATREIPVIGEFAGTLISGYEADPVMVSPSTLEVSGPETVVNQIAHAVVTVRDENVKSSVDQELLVVLVDQKGNILAHPSLTLSSQMAKVFMPVVRVYDIPLEVTLIDGGGAKSAGATYTISPATVRLSGPDEVLSGLRKLSLGEINLGEVFEGVPAVLPIPIPEGMTNRNGETEASVSVTFKDLQMKSISANQIHLINVPQGYRATLVTESLQVWIRGAQAALDQVTADKIQVTVDLTDAVQTTGQQWVPATINLEGSTEAGVVGAEYSVAVNLGR